MDLFLTGRIGRALLRETRCRDRFVLEPIALRQVEPCGWHARDLADAGVIEFLRQWLPEGEGAVIDLRVARPGERVQADGICCHVTAGQLPPGSFRRICQPGKVNGNPLRGVNLYVDGPALAYVGYANELLARVRAKKMDVHDARVACIAYGSELCGMYTLGAQPGEDPTYSIDRVCSASLLGRYLDALSDIPGAKLARQMARYVLEWSNSPRETLVGLVLSNPPRLGGVSLGFDRLNETMDLSARHDALVHRQMTPDIMLKQYGIAIEYNGRDSHSKERALRDDKHRIEDYSTLGDTLFILRKEDVGDATSLERTLLRIAYAIQGRGFARDAKRVRHILEDAGTHDARARLIRGCEAQTRNP